MSSLDDFQDITRRDVPLNQYSWLKTGGPAQFLIEPRTFDELQKVVRCCHDEQIPVHVLGGGSNVLIRDEGVAGVVLRLVAPEFEQVAISGNIVTAGAGALLSHVVSRSIEAGLGGFENLVGIPGTIGGALKGNAGGRSGDIGSYTKSVTVLTAKGERFIRTEEELTFEYRESSINELVILEASFELQPGDAEQISQKMRRIWITKKAAQPLAFQSAGCVFRNPRGLSAGALIEQANLKGTRLGHCEVSDRHANFIVTEDGATTHEVKQLIDMIRAKVLETHGVELELELQVW
ncbi:MAG: UDP-N-acetylmuramate dehydrogenase [Planctomycetaceae bacterium]